MERGILFDQGDRRCDKGDAARSAPMPPPPLSAAQIEEMLSHREWLEGLAFRLIGNHADAEDVVQEAFLRTLRRPPRRPGPLGAWLAQVTRNLAANLGRSRARTERRIRDRSAAASAEAKHEADPVLESVQKVETEQLLLEELMLLPEVERDVLLLRFERELPFARIAQELDGTEAGVRQRSARAVDHLQRRLGLRMGKDWRQTLGMAFGLPLRTGVPVLTLTGAIAAGLAVSAGALWLLFAAGNAADEAEPETAAAASPPPRSALRDASAAAAEAAEETRLLGPLAPAAPPLGARWSWSGRVVEVDGTPVGGAEVRATCRRLRRSVVAGADGRFLMPLDAEWDPDATSLIANAPDLGVGHRLELLGVPAGQQLDLILERGSGHQRVLVVDPEGRPLAGVGVSASQNQRMAQRLSDSDGLARFLLPPDRSFSVSAGVGFGRPVSRSRSGTTSLHALRSNPAPLRLEVVPYATQFRLRAVEAQAQTPVAAAAFLWRQEMGWLLDDTAPFHELPTAGPGLLDHRHPSPGDAIGVWIEAPGLYPRHVVLNSDAPGFATVPLRPPDPGQLTVLDGDSRPAAGVEVAWWVDRPSHAIEPRFTRGLGGSAVRGRAAADDRGRLTLPLPADLSDCRLSFEASRGGSLVAEVGGVEASLLPADRDWVWQLAPPRLPVEAVVLDHSGAPLAGVAVFVNLGSVTPFDDLSRTFEGKRSNAATGARTDAVTDAHGVARFQLDPGAVLRWSLKPGNQDPSFSFSHGPREPDTLPLAGSFRREFRTGHGTRKVTGRLLYADGSPAVAGMVVEAFLVDGSTSPGLERVAGTQVVEDGRFTLTLLPEASVELRVQDWTETIARYSMEAGAVDPVYWLPNFRRLTVHPIDPETSQPMVADVRCEIYLDSGDEFRLSTQDGESMDFDQLPRSPGWLFCYVFPDGLPVARRLQGGEPEFFAFLRAGRLARVPIVGYSGDQLPEGVLCTLEGELPGDPSWTRRRYLDENGQVILRGAPQGSFRVQLRDRDWEPIGPPIPSED